jgi:DNA-binding response OmpR family regulator
VHALEIGADDYLVKLFRCASWSRALGAPRGAAQPSERRRRVEIEELRIDPREVQAFVDGQSAG